MTSTRGPDFIGLGAQKAGTSWIYACLYEHPAICIPIKEIHFFSHEDKWRKGTLWYESHFAKCETWQKAGEFCTTYLSHPMAAARIHEYYPSVKLLACLRNPVDRAFSNYVNDIKAGLISPKVSFREALSDRREYLQRGFYSQQLERFLRFFPRDKIHISIYENIAGNPLKFIQDIYRFIGVSDDFVPSMLNARVNVARVPRFVVIEKVTNRVADILRRLGCGNFVWAVKRARLPDLLRWINTRKRRKQDLRIMFEDKIWLYEQFRSEIESLEDLIGINLDKWRV